MNVHRPLAGNCKIPSTSKTGLEHCLLCAQPTPTAVPLRAVKVMSGKIVHAISEHGEATSPRTTAVGVDAPDGVYLRMDFVTETLRRDVDNLRMTGDDKYEAIANTLQSMAEFFEARTL